MSAKADGTQVQPVNLLHFNQPNPNHTNTITTGLSNSVNTWFVKATRCAMKLLSKLSKVFESCQAESISQLQSHPSSLFLQVVAHCNVLSHRVATPRHFGGSVLRIPLLSPKDTAERYCCCAGLAQTIPNTLLR